MTTNIGIEQFGRDHWSALAYFETLAVDGKGRIDHRRMRCNNARHPLMAHLPAEFVSEHPTRLKDGVLLRAHDDWDCLDDLVAAGLVQTDGSGLHPIVALTPEGWRIAAALRRHRAGSGIHARSYETFDLSSEVA